MSADFFLENRGHQLARLCCGDQAQFSIPAANGRQKLPPELRSFYELLDRICASCGTTPAGEAAGGLSAAARADILSFERAVVRLRFSANAAVKTPAVQLIKAVFADAEYFSGLKPLPQYNDVFAYELLFPSWLNLLKATMLPQASGGKPRLTGKQQCVLFDFLGKVHALAPACETELVGFLTFLASRFDAPHCEELLQRSAELYSLHGCSFVETIDSFELAAKDARQFSRWLQDYLIVRHSFSKWPSQSEYPISYARPAIRVLPAELQSRLGEMEAAREQWPKYFQIARPLRQLIQSDHLLTAEYVAVLDKHPQDAAPLLKLVLQSDEQGQLANMLSTEGQECLALLIEHETQAGASPDFDKLGAFAELLAPRLHGYSESTVAYFCRMFVLDKQNRKLVLEACGDEAKRRALSAYVLEQAGKTDDDARFLNLLACVTVLSPDEAHLQARPALQAIDAVLLNRSIGNKEFSDLVGDLQANFADAITYLACPIMAASGKEPRLAMLYMTLNEISETLASSGKVDNFSVVRAKYSKLINSDLG